MDTNTAPGMSAPDMSAPDAMRRSDSGAVAQTLPLPFDDERDEPVPFVLTAAAHREVLGRTVGPLPADVAPTVDEVVAGPDAAIDEGAAELMRAQSRALLRSGMPIGTIAAALGADVGSVTRCTADLGDELARRRRRRPVDRRSNRDVLDLAGVGAVSGSGAVGAGETDHLLAGLAYALAAIEDESVAISHDRVGPVAVLLRALRSKLDVHSSRIRVAVRVGADMPVDRTRTMVAEQLGVEAATIVVGRTTEPGARALELRVDIRDVAVAALLWEWRDGGQRGGSGLRGWDSNPQTFRLTADCSAN